VAGRALLGVDRGAVRLRPRGRGCGERRSREGGRATRGERFVAVGAIPHGLVRWSFSIWIQADSIAPDIQPVM
jgi:hypothetical protein